MGAENPYGGSSADRLIAMINEENGTDYVNNLNVTVGPPFATVGDGLSNTRVIVKAIEDMRYDGEMEILYNRLPLEALVSESGCPIGPVYIESLPFSIHEILDRLNDVYRTNISPDEVEDEVFTEKRDKYPLKIKEDVSLAWLRSEFEFPVKWPFGMLLAEREEIMDRLHILVHEGLPETQDPWPFDE